MIRKIAWLSATLVLLAAGLLFGWYQIDGIPTVASEGYLNGDGFSYSEDADGGLLFTPDDSNGDGIVIMHGALIKPQSYSKSAAYFAALGYTVYLPAGPARLSLYAVDETVARIAELEPDSWFFIGHSMGGLSSFELIRRHNVDAKAVALWATAIPADYSELDVPVLFIWGDVDGLLPVERLALSKPNLPDKTRYLTLAGANHKNFALYSHQFFDRDATIDWIEQIDFANRTTADFFTEFR